MAGREIKVSIYPDEVFFDGAKTPMSELEETVKEYRKLNRPFRVTFTCGFASKDCIRRVHSMLGTTP